MNSETSDKTIRFPCIELNQPIGRFYVGSMSASDLVEISFADVRRLEARDIERYLGIQRPLEPRRVQELVQYVTTKDATFPTGVILAISSEHAEYHAVRREMSIVAAPDVAKIIDGQHRIAGLEKATVPFETPVVIFIDMDIEDQAMVFATINLKQTKVNRSLAYDLFEYAKTRSPQRTCHQIARLLNSEPESPFYNRIKILGTATPGEKSQTITQALFVDSLMALITDNPMRDRDMLMRGTELSWNPRMNIRMPFRRLFLDERDAVIAKTVSNYFSAIRDRWPHAWDDTSQGMILTRTTGFSAAMRFLRDVLHDLEFPLEVVPQDKFFAVLMRVNMLDSDFHRDRFVPGSSGMSQLLRAFQEAMRLPLDGG